MKDDILPEVITLENIKASKSKTKNGPAAFPDRTRFSTQEQRKIRQINQSKIEHNLKKKNWEEKKLDFEKMQ